MKMGKGWDKEKARHSMAKKFGKAPPYRAKKNLGKPRYFEGKNKQQIINLWEAGKSIESIQNPLNVTELEIHTVIEDWKEKFPKYDIVRQRGFADGHEHYTVEKNGEIMGDADGNNWHFETYEEAQEFVEQEKKDYEVIAPATPESEKEAIEKEEKIGRGLYE